MPLLDIRNLTIELDTPHGRTVALDRFSLKLGEGEIHGLVGESGSGKSLLAKAILGIVDRRTHVRADRLSWNGRNLLEMSASERRALMGREIAMIFQEPTSCLDPSARIGTQLLEAMPEPEGVRWWWQKRSAKKAHAIRLLHKVGVKQHTKMMKAFPWELTDGQAHKVMLAMALAHQPKLLIADEPTTGLETATQAQIYRLLDKLNQLRGVAILLISHDLDSVARLAKKISVLYCGQLMESGRAKQLLNKPMHPYTQALIQSALTTSSHLEAKSPLSALPGGIPPMHHLPVGCRLGPRCPYARRECVQPPRIRTQMGQAFRCHYPLNPIKKEPQA
ncbi:oligopeptide/dipeptide ABC transporter ATP-binding protein [Ferrimonas balearica]|uniref:peptide ABC transporter ATP-binding protein n=1 Tax=Ferrimonas balearica TaxID=44012 RepID=UPI001C992555|nr:oligopeptide/dipeptide ABC transporter ATP-binding protein [Ferrimonas balearica]MBY5922149.1 ATP-binding cassette domain-containing protein [Ferrimonas balearica]MBY5994511.1 ATP-binding cassette domain-containing protein [Ferrimonas balearica]